MCGGRVGRHTTIHGYFTEWEADGLAEPIRRRVEQTFGIMSRLTAGPGKVRQYPRP